MEEKQIMEKWVIIPLSIPAREVVQVDYKLPANVTHCTGVALSVSGLAGYYLPNTLGELSLSFNNKESQPLCFPANWTPSCFRLDFLLCKLEQPIMGGSRVNGYFKNKIPFAYSLKIYLQCLSLI